MREVQGGEFHQSAHGRSSPAKRTTSALLRANGVVLRSRGGNPRRLLRHTRAGSAVHSSFELISDICRAISEAFVVSRRIQPWPPSSFLSRPRAIRLRTGTTTSGTLSGSPFECPIRPRRAAHARPRPRRHRSPPDHRVHRPGHQQRSPDSNRHVAAALLAHLQVRALGHHRPSVITT